MFMDRLICFHPLILHIEEIAGKCLYLAFSTFQSFEFDFDIQSYVIV